MPDEPEPIVKEYEGHGLGRREEFDEQSRDFPMRALLGAERPLRSYTHSLDLNRRKNQRREGACVSFGLHHAMMARPRRTREFTEQELFEAYFNIQRQDQWPGGAYPGANPRYHGTSTLAGVQYLQKRGMVSSYYWGFRMREILEALAYAGPVGIGVTMREGMMDTDSNGYIHDTGAEVGGHCMMLNSINVRNEDVGGINSWGLDWGIQGAFRMKWADLERRLKARGEAVIMVKTGIVI